MNPVTRALAAALRDLRQPRVLALALLPPLAAIAAWIALGWTLADDWERWSVSWISSTPWLAWVRDWGLSSAFTWVSGLLVLALLAPVALVAALVVTDLVAMPVIVPLVGGRHFPALERRNGGTAAGSAANAVKAILLFTGLWLLTLPLWLTGIGALLLPPLLSAQLNQRMFRYDALAEHASADEYRQLVERSGGELFTLGVALSLLLYVPLVNLLVPVLSGLAFTHFCLARLQRLRAASVQVTRG